MASNTEPRPECGCKVEHKPNCEFLGGGHNGRFDCPFPDNHIVYCPTHDPANVAKLAEAAEWVYDMLADCANDKIPILPPIAHKHADRLYTALRGIGARP